MNFEVTTTFLLAQLSTAFKVMLEKHLAEIKLHGGQIFILFELWKTDGQSQIELAKKLSVSPPTINKMIKSLRDNSFVSCNKCENDGRAVRVFLTRHGIDVRQKVVEQWQKVEEQVTLNLTETEKLVFIQLFGKMKDNLGNDYENNFSN